MCCDVCENYKNKETVAVIWDIVRRIEWGVVLWVGEGKGEWCHFSSSFPFFLFIFIGRTWVEDETKRNWFPPSIL